MSKLIIKGKKVILRPLSIKDAKNFCEWLGDPEVTQFLLAHDLPKPSLKEEQGWIKKARLGKNRNLNLAIDSIDGTHIGSISLKNIDKINKNAEFGIMIGHKRYWGQGCGTEATKLLVEHGFKKLKLHRIYLTYIAFNERAGNTYKKIGFKVEGRQREHIFRNGAFHDHVQMGILKNEFIKKYGSR